MDSFLRDMQVPRAGWLSSVHLMLPDQVQYVRQFAFCEIMFPSATMTEANEVTRKSERSLMFILTDCDGVSILEKRRYLRN